MGEGQCGFSTAGLSGLEEELVIGVPVFCSDYLLGVWEAISLVTASDPHLGCLKGRLWAVLILVTWGPCKSVRVCVCVCS